ncbi:MAG: hypothetical protein R3B47_02580 [Bacteroidia bacterium]
MNKFGKIAGWNIALLVAYSAIIVGFGSGRGDDFVGIGLICMLQSVICFVVSIVLFIMKDSKSGFSWLATSAILMVIGFSTCAGGFSSTGFH